MGKEWSRVHLASLSAGLRVMVPANGYRSVASGESRKKISIFPTESTIALKGHRQKKARGKKLEGKKGDRSVCLQWNKISLFISEMPGNERFSGCITVHTV